MANAGCINAYDCNGCLIQTLQNLDSACIGVGVQYTAPNPLDDKRLDYIKYTDKCGCVQCLSAENEILIYATNGVIKNLTLTNDDVNEAIKIKWNDIFGSNRAKTIVRYKTGSAPVSITDGTLAVEETTKNQYSSTPFSLSGVLDETTYYISAFAVDSNGTIIDVQTKQITTEFNWKPGINTVMYFPFISDQSDKVGSCSLPVSGTKQSLGYRFSAGPGAQLNYSNVPSNMCFVSFFIKVHALKTNSSYPHAQTPNTGLGNINYSFAHSSGSEYLKKFGIVTSYSGGSATWLAWGNTYNRSYEQRIHFAYGCDGTKAIAYINGVKYGEVTTTSARPGSAGFIRNVDADYSELIGEKAMRSEADIVKYFNKMKSKYGIS